MTTGRVWLAAVVALLALVLVVGARTVPTGPGGPGAALGPDGGTQVPGYLARASAALDEVGPDEQRWALLSPSAELGPADAAALAAGVRTSRVLLEVPVDRVQTPLDAVEVADQGGDLAAELTELQRLAGGRQSAQAEVGAGRAAAVAAVAGARLRAGCACVVGLVVRGTGDELRTVAARAGVRALEPAPEGAGYGGLSVVPLLPGQVLTVGPTPDDGVVPDAVFPTSGISASGGGG